jgi:hypothetical protein
MSSSTPHSPASPSDARLPTTTDPRRTPADRAEERLRTTFRLNALTSLATGVLAAVAAGPLDRVLGTGHPGIVRAVGLGLILFAVDVALLSRRGTASLVRRAPAVIVADAAWVAASVGGIIAGWFDPAGAVLVGAAAIVVGGFAVVQWHHLAELRGDVPDGRSVMR